MKYPIPVTWTCHVCGETRPDAQISVFHRDVSAVYQLKRGTIINNIRYCNDNPECARRAAGARSLEELYTAQRQAKGASL